MSQSRIAPRKSSPCCIGCVVVLVIGIGLAIAMGIFGYRFFKENIGLVDVVNIPDPALDTGAEVLFPQTVGEFTRVALNEPVTEIPGVGDTDTSGIVTAKYEDTQSHSITAIAVPTEVARSQRTQDFGLLTAGRGRANDPNTGISIKNPVDGASTTLTWSKENWTFVVYTTSTVAAKFAEAYRPGGAEATAPGEAQQDQQTTAVDTTAETAPAEATPVAAEITPAPAEPALDSASTTGI